MNYQDTTRPIITPLVRQYSLKAEEDMPEDTLSQALGGIVRKEDEDAAKLKQQMLAWRRWIDFGSTSNDADLDPLENHSQRVVLLWKRFSYLLPSDMTSPHSPNNVPTISTLYEAIQQAEQEWTAKQAKGLTAMKGKFMYFADTMNDYSYLFKVIPDGDKYTSLITGVVSSVVTVSVNHKKIAEGFSQAISDVSDHLRSIKKTARIADSPDMRGLVIKLYTEVFELLCNGLLWFTSKRKRFGAAFNKNFYDDTVAGLVTKIERTVEAIDREARNISDNRLQEIHQVVVEGGLQVVDRLRPLGNQNRRDDTQAIQAKFDVMIERMREELGFQSVQTLEFVEEHHAYDLQVQECTSQASHPPEQEEAVEELSEIGADSTSEGDEQFARYDIEKLASRLSEYLNDGRQQITKAIRGNPSSMLPSEVLLEIQKWIKAGTSKKIWVQGVSAMPHGVGLTLAALRICDISIQAGIPCVSFFCKRNYDFEAAKSLASKDAGLVALLYSVVSQLTCLLPTALPAVEGLEESNFRLLDGTMGSIPAALRLIRALLVHAPPSLIWVIDGLQLTETKATIPHLRAFLDILREEETKRISKVCFTTEGNCFVLTQATTVLERVDTLRAAQNRPGAIMRGGSDVSELQGPIIK